MNICPGHFYESCLDRETSFNLFQYGWFWPKTSTGAFMFMSATNIFSLNVLSLLAVFFNCALLVVHSYNIVCCLRVNIPELLYWLRNNEFLIFYLHYLNKSLQCPGLYQKSELLLLLHLVLFRSSFLFFLHSLTACLQPSISDCLIHSPSYFSNTFANMKVVFPSFRFMFSSPKQ